MPKQSQKGRCAARGEVQPRRWTMQVQLHNCTNTISRAEPHEIKIAHAFMHYALMATHQTQEREKWLSLSLHLDKSVQNVWKLHYHAQ